MIFPALSRMSWSSRSKITGDGWWMVTTSVHPKPCSWDLTMCMTSEAMAESRPVVGSSRKMALGLYSRPIEMESLFLSPPLRPLTPIPGFPTMVCAAWSKLICFRTWCTLWIFSSLLHLSWGSLHMAANRTLSNTVQWQSPLLITSSLCSTYEASLLTSDIVGLCASYRTSPYLFAGFFSLCEMASSRVVLPAPDGPIRPYISPLRITAVTSFNVVFVDLSFLLLKMLNPSFFSIWTLTLCREIVRPLTACSPVTDSFFSMTPPALLPSSPP
mmetsp:Transcript_9967/g.28329  ORF Transcript_9967/g.28329 Transcript_9967/m.28329 type:complete len:272 (-) Transcript_9967:229-1044(-)